MADTDFFPGSVNTTVLKDTLSDLLPNTEYSLKSIRGTSKKFIADFYLTCTNKEEVARFVQSPSHQKIQRNITKMALIAESKRTTVVVFVR